MTSLLDPSDPRPVHFVGVGGAGMSALALAALRRGVSVTGCDRDDAAFADLVAAGARVTVGHDPAHVAGARAVVVTAAVPVHHPEIQAALAAGIPVVPRKQALASLVNGTRLVAIAGTHGKTTTTVMTTEALRGAGMGASGLAGGRVRSWGGNALLDADDLFVVEADEYDQAFLALHPRIAVINNVEADHLECYGSVEAMELAYVSFAGRAERVLVGMADPGSQRVAEALGDLVWRFGVDAGDVRITNVGQTAAGSRATVEFPDGARVTLELTVPGEHNLRNATAALAVAHAMGAPLDGALDALRTFSGVGRRFDRLGEVAGVMIVDDYAHHATELQATIAAARQAFPERRLVAVFQPHLYSRTREQGAVMGAVLAAADVAVITDVYGAREQPEPGVSGKIVADAAWAQSACVVYEPDRERLLDQVLAVVREGDVLLTLGAGDITTLGRAAAAQLENR